MQTKDIKQFYNKNLSSTSEEYEKRRWFKNSQAKAGYVGTYEIVHKLVRPLIINCSNVLELGPGPGTWTKELLKFAPNANYTLVDISEEMLSQAKQSLGKKKNINFVCSDILDYRVQNAFDFFFSSRIIEYVPDKKTAVKNIVNAIEIGAVGYIATKTPQGGRLIGKKVVSSVHKHQIDPITLAQLFQDSGCKVTMMQHVTGVFPLLRSGLADRVITKIIRALPFRWGLCVSESYCIIFCKKR